MDEGSEKNSIAVAETGVTMQPIAVFRWFHRKITDEEVVRPSMDGAGTHVGQPVLQQMWHGVTHGHGSDNEIREWRDVPVVMEGEEGDWKDVPVQE